MGEIIGGVEVSYIAINYASLIQENLYEFDNVKTRFKLDTAICLVVWGYPDKVTGTDSKTGKTWLELANEKIEEANK